MSRKFYIVFRTKNGGYRRGRKPYPSKQAAQDQLERTGNLNWKHIAERRMPWQTK